MKMQRIETPGIAHYAYLIADGTEAAVIDPGRFVEPYLEAAKTLGVRVTHILETHRQEDFAIKWSWLQIRQRWFFKVPFMQVWTHGWIRANVDSILLRKPLYRRVADENQIDAVRRLARVCTLILFALPTGIT